MRRTRPDSSSYELSRVLPTNALVELAMLHQPNNDVPARGILALLSGERHEVRAGAVA